MIDPTASIEALRSDLRATLAPEHEAPSYYWLQLTYEICDKGDDDNAGGGSEAGLDGQEEYNIQRLFQGVKAHPVQGYHVKLTINTQPLAQGADVKHKVFWVEGCYGNGGGYSGR